MMALNLVWARRGLHPDRSDVPGALLDAEGWFVWVPETIGPQSKIRTYEPPDKDADRIRQMRLEIADQERERREASARKALIETYERVTSNPYALRDAAGRAGVDCDIFLAQLEAEALSYEGYPVDLNADGVPEFETVIAPAVARHAARNSWSTQEDWERRGGPKPPTVERTWRP